MLMPLLLPLRLLSQRHQANSILGTRHYHSYSALRPAPCRSSLERPTTMQAWTGSIMSKVSPFEHNSVLVFSSAVASIL